MYITRVNFSYASKVVFSEKLSVADFWVLEEYLTREDPTDDEKQRELRARVVVEKLAYYAERIENVIGMFAQIAHELNDLAGQVGLLKLAIYSMYRAPLRNSDPADPSIVSLENFDITPSPVIRRFDLSIKSKTGALVRAMMTLKQMGQYDPICKRFMGYVGAIQASDPDGERWRFNDQLKSFHLLQEVIDFHDKPAVKKFLAELEPLPPGEKFRTELVLQTL